jgi:type 1 fimbria pilin
MKIGVLAALILATAACGAYVFPAETPSPTSGNATVTGRVIAVPCAPVEQQGAVCAGRPVPNLEIDYVSGVTIEAKAVTASDGTYAVVLRPRSYTVRMKTYMRVISGPLNLTVAAGSKTVANYVLDTGIRLPQPQQ